MLGGFIFGWAKPVPVDYRNLHNPKRDMAIVAVAGPLANLGMAILWALVAKTGLALPETLSWASVPMVLMGKIGIFLNLILMVLNLLPLPPLDGGRVVTGLLPARWSVAFAKIEPYGFFVLIALLATGILGKILGPPIVGLEKLIFTVTGI
jgi:Zn-dependent protease